MKLPGVAWTIAFFAVFAKATAMSDNTQLANVVTGYPACKPVAAPARFQPLAFNSSTFIWTGEVSQPGGNNPLGARGFRKVVASPPGKCATCAEMIVAADDFAQVFVNNKLIGGSNDSRAGSVFFTGLKPSSNIFALLGNNIHDQSPAGVAATIKIHYADGTSETIVTDDSWRTLRGVAPPNSFPQATVVDNQRRQLNFLAR
ncbi:hypothetical protein ONZ45_g10531 [Pleurotus djamor]|nr:hypothetical protein ONZ45_g10531 [Pleurotus djamor]